MRWLLRLAGLAMFVTVAVVVGYYLLFGRFRIPETDATELPISPEPATYAGSLTHDGRDRTFLFHVPEAARNGVPLPLVILLHGGGGRADRTDAVAGMIELADREGFYVLLPQGVDRNWNDGRPDAGSRAAEENIDDVGFIATVLDHLAERVPVDTSRVYATGISNGAMMSVRLACDLSDRIAAIGVVAGTAPAALAETCAPGRPVSVIAFHGTDDPLVPYEGGEIRAFFGLAKRGKVVSVDALKDFWVTRNGCSTDSAQEALPDVNSEDGSTVAVESYAGCAEAAEVIFYRIDGGGHTWPGGRQYLSHLLVGKTNHDIKATEVMWSFFQRHGRP